MDAQVVSRARVIEHGEVYTLPWFVNAMLDLVQQETERIDSRFLEPACGTGNFLAEVLSRKLAVVEADCSRTRLDYERNAVLANTSIYGIDILADNVALCRQRLFDLFDAAYSRLFGPAAQDTCRASVRYILSQNIVHGDARKMQTVGDDPQPVVLPEWSFVGRSMLKRRDFAFRELVGQGSLQGLPLFSDLGEDAFIPTPIRDYPLMHYLSIGETTSND
jgi:hypothetical protein